MRVALARHLTLTCRVGIPTGVSSFQRLSSCVSSPKVQIPLCASAFHPDLSFWNFEKDSQMQQTAN